MTKCKESLKIPKG